MRERARVAAVVGKYAISRRSVILGLVRRSLLAVCIRGSSKKYVASPPPLSSHKRVEVTASERLRVGLRRLRLLVPPVRFVGT